MYQTILSEIRKSIPFELGNDVWNIIYEMLNVKHPAVRMMKRSYILAKINFYNFKKVKGIECYNDNNYSFTFMILFVQYLKLSRMMSEVHNFNHKYEEHWNKIEYERNVGEDFSCIAGEFYHYVRNEKRRTRNLKFVVDLLIMELNPNGFFAEPFDINSEVLDQIEFMKAVGHY